MSQLLHLSDLHGNKPWFDWVAKQARATGCAVAISGDLVDADAHQGISALKRQMDWISAWVRTADFPLFLCSGNHDIVLSDNADWLRDLARPSVTVDGGIGGFGSRSITCLPWGSESEEFLRPEVLKSDVWLHHAPPSECNLGRSDYGGQSMDFGSDDLFAALSPAWGARAQLVLSGHVHTATKWRAKCGNALCLNAAGDNPNAPVPKHVLIDLEASTAILRNGLMVDMVRLPDRILGYRLNGGNAATDS
jgi:Icc-related predicted phosphoesterase